MFNFLGNTPRLIPMDQGPEIRQKVTHFRNIIDEIPANLITVGSFIHSDLVASPKAPFFRPVRSTLVSKFNYFLFVILVIISGFIYFALQIKKRVVVKIYVDMQN